MNCSNDMVKYKKETIENTLNMKHNSNRVFIFTCLIVFLLFSLYFIYNNNINSGYDLINYLKRRKSDISSSNNESLFDNYFVNSNNNSNNSQNLFYDLIENKHENLDLWSKKTPKKARIFCIILTSEASLNLKARAIYKTWAKKCDNFKFVAKMPKDKTQIAFLDQNDFLEPPGLNEDVYQKLTRKVFLTIKHIYNVYNDYDFYIKAGLFNLVFFYSINFNLIIVFFIN